MASSTSSAPPVVSPPPVSIPDVTLDVQDGTIGSTGVNVRN